MTSASQSAARSHTFVGVQRGFLVAVGGISSAQISEDFRGRVGGHDLGEKTVDSLLMRIKQWAHLLGSVSAHPSLRPHHQTSLFQHLTAGAALQEAVKQEPGDGDAYRKPGPRSG
jgi:hypothetical protein